MSTPILPIGVEFFEAMRKHDNYYIDKTLFIRDLLDDVSPGSVNLFTRPRRFGKTLMMTMLQSFFEKTDEDTAALFRGLNIERAGEKYMAHQGRYPVVFVTLKGVAGGSYEMAYALLKAIVADEAMRHGELATSERLTAREIEQYNRLSENKMTPDDLHLSLMTLCNLLEKHHGQKVILLIDEYDVPLDRAYLSGYYEEMIVLMRSFLGFALKSNFSLHFAVLTGCLRISRESIFTGLNNLKVWSILDHRFTEYFGFTLAEVEKLLTDYGVPQGIEAAKAWYDGYRFGTFELYNPWDILNFCNALRNNPNAEPELYWINTSGNDFVLRFLTDADTYTREDIERLIDGQTVRKRIRPEITYGEIDQDPENLWSLLLLTGYLTVDGERDEYRTLPLRIPNAEVRQIYIDKLAVWYKQSAKALDLRALYAALFEGDAQVVEGELNKLMLDTISYHDSFESFYHGFLVGLLMHNPVWAMSSNQEAGYGRADILLEGRDRVRAAVIELKMAKEERGLDEACAAAIAQIEGRGYMRPLVRKGFQRVYGWGIAFCGKVCRVVCAQETAAG